MFLHDIWKHCFKTKPTDWHFVKIWLDRKCSDQLENVEELISVCVTSAVLKIRFDWTFLRIIQEPYQLMISWMMLNSTNCSLAVCLKMCTRTKIQRGKTKHAVKYSFEKKNDFCCVDNGIKFLICNASYENNMFAWSFKV